MRVGLLSLVVVAASGLAGAACHLHGSSSEAWRNPPEWTYKIKSITYSGGGKTETVAGAFIAPAFFEETRLQPLLGRAFVAEEYEQNPKVVMVSEAFWKERLGKDYEVVGRELEFDGQKLALIGVMPRGADVPSGTQVWLPMRATGGKHE